MHQILLLGAGRSASSLIRYLLENAPEEKWRITVADASQKLAEEKVAGNVFAEAVGFDIHDAVHATQLVRDCDIVISLLPPDLHIRVAIECIRQKKNLITASYVNEEMRALHNDAVDAGIVLLNECGLDPGIDHMSAMKVIDGLQAKGAEFLSFRSYTGGLVAPESNDNPWGYKFSWNPRNVIVAGQGTARFIEEGRPRYIPYSRLFRQTVKMEVEGAGTFEGYANRDSLPYRKLYRLDQIPTLLRGTLRYENYCRAWDVFVQLGLTDDSYRMIGSAEMTYAEIVDALLPPAKGKQSLRKRVAEIAHVDPEGDIMDMIEWTGVLANDKPGLPDATPAMILQKLLGEKWKLGKDDIDMVVMQHEFVYNLEGKRRRLTSSLVVKGEDPVYTAMAKTVGLPAGIAARNILKGMIIQKGVLIPVEPEIYIPVLKELEASGIVFTERLSEPA